jgi:hypothetical protein
MALELGYLVLGCLEPAMQPKNVAMLALPAALADQKFVVLGAGSAGMGVVSMIAQGEHLLHHLHLAHG